MFSEKFRNWRRKKELSQIEVAKKLGVTQQAVANWETGIRHPDKKHWKKLIELTDGEITLEDFLTEDPRKTPAEVR